MFVLGDSYTQGAGFSPAEGYAAEAARIAGWQVVIGGYSGTGFVNPGRVHETLAELFERQLSWRPAPDLMIVSGGHNDWLYPPSKVGTAVAVLLRRIKLRWPHTPVVVLGPLWGGDPVPKVLLVRDAIRAAAKSTRTPFIDPLAEHWVTGGRKKGTGNAKKLILPDGTHPTLEGHRYIAERLVTDLRKLHLAHPS